MVTCRVGLASRSCLGKRLIREINFPLNGLSFHRGLNNARFRWILCHSNRVARRPGQLKLLNRQPRTKCSRGNSAYVTCRTQPSSGLDNKDQAGLDTTPGRLRHRPKRFVLNRRRVASLRPEFRRVVASYHRPTRSHLTSGCVVPDVPLAVR
jgi:hypothetical protein